MSKVFFISLCVLFFSVGAVPIVVRTGSWVNDCVVEDGGTFSIDSAVLKSSVIDSLFEDASSGTFDVGAGPHIPVAVSQGIFSYLHDVQILHDECAIDEILSGVTDGELREIIEAAYYLGVTFNCEAACALLRIFVSRFGNGVLDDEFIVSRLMAVVGDASLDLLCRWATRCCWHVGELFSFVGHLGSPMAVSSSINHRFLICGDGNGLVLVVDMAEMFIRSFEVEGQVNGLQISPDGRSFLIASRAELNPVGTLYLCDFDLHNLRRTFSNIYGYFDAIFSPDGEHVLVYSIYDEHNGRYMAQLVRCDTLATQSSFCCQDPISAAIFSPDGRTLYMGTSSGTIHVFDVATATQTTSWEGHASSVNTFAMSLNGSLLVSGSGDVEEGYPDCSASVWDAHAGSLIYRLQFPSDVVSVRFLDFGMLFCGTLFDGSYFCENGAIKNRIESLNNVCSSTNLTFHGKNYLIVAEQDYFKTLIPLSLNTLTPVQKLFVCRLALLGERFSGEDVQGFFPIYTSLPANVQDFVLSIAPQFAEV